MQNINQLNMESRYEDYLELIFDLFNLAHTFLVENIGIDYKLPIPIRNILKNNNLLVHETSLRNDNTMERDNYGGFSTIASSNLRIINYGPNKGKVGGIISIESKISEYEKRFYLAHELARYILTKKEEIYPFIMFPIVRGQYSLGKSVSDFLVDELTYAILMPYDLIMGLKEQYEKDNTYNPLSYREWLNYLENLVQIPIHNVILGYEEIRKVQLIKTKKLIR